MNKKSKEIVKKLCFTLVIVISIITIIGCPNTVSNKTDSGADKPSSNGIPWTPLYDPNDWSGLTADQVIQKMEIKDKSDEIVHSKDGLSFGWRDNKLCLLSTEESYPAGSNNANYPLDKAFEKIKDEIGDEGIAFIPTSFDSVSDGLEKRWIAARETKYAKDKDKWLNRMNAATGYINAYIGSTNDLENKEAAKFANIYQHFAVDKNRDIFVFTDNPSAIHFADWEIVFVEKVVDPEIPKIYSFHYGPYILWDKGHPNSQDNPKSLIDVNYNKDVHMFTLSGMLEDYLRNKKKVPEGIAEQVATRFSENKGKYDVYLVVGKFYMVGDSIMYGYERTEYSFRNVLKLSDYDNYWKGCWKP